jgi:Flp pilus assembly protein TadD
VTLTAASTTDLRQTRAALEAQLARAPTDLATALRLAPVLVELKQPGAAVSLLQGLLVHHPADADLRLALGAALVELGEPGLAAPVFLKATRLAPERLSPRLMLAKCLAAGRPADALSILKQTAEMFPDAAEVWSQMGTIQRTLGDHVSTERSFRRSAELSPDDFNALNNHGVALRALERFEDAVALYRRALKLSPQAAVVHANLGNALDALGRNAEAETHLRMAWNAAPSIDARYNLAAHLVRAEQPEEAIPHLRFVVDAAPHRWDAWTNLGVALVAAGAFAEAEACYRKAIAIRPGTPEPHYNLAWLLLLMGRWAEGWAEYEWRWQLPHLKDSVVKPWDGTPQPSATILLRCEQGLGDAIQFIRFAKEVRARCHRVAVACPPSLVSLFSNIVEATAFDAPPPQFDLDAHLLSLPKLLGVTPETIPAADRYISAPLEIPAHLKLPLSKRAKIGFVWAGSTDNKIDRRRSCDVAHFEGLFAGLEVDAVSMQVGPKASELPASTAPVFDLNGKTRDWSDTAAVLAQLDLVIGVDTGVMHLAGALGKPAWILLPFSPDFRWLLERTDTPWYHSVKLWRQERRGDWAGVFGNLRGALTVWLQNRP